MEDEYGRRTAAFLAWFKSLPGAYFHPGIEIQDMRSRGAGRGIVATSGIEPDTLLFTIPRKSVICSATSELPHRIPGVFEVDDNLAAGAADDEAPDSSRQQDSWSSLILVLIYEQLLGPVSSWKPYLDVLPAHFTTPMFWTDTDVAGLQASPVVSQIGRDQADAMIRAKILPVIREHEDVFFPTEGGAPGDEEIIALANRMGSTIMAYAFDLERDEDEDDGEGEEGWVEDREGQIMMGMVPMADILNADADFNAHVNHGEDFLTVTSLRRIAAGEEILNYYGPLSNGELLRRYGYVTPKHRRYNLVDLPWELVVSSLRQSVPIEDRLWQKALEQLDPDELEDSFEIERDAGEPDSAGRVSDHVLPAGVPHDLLEQSKALLKAVKKVAPEAVNDRATRDRVMYAAFLAAIDARASQYPTTLEQDEELYRENERTAAVNPRLHMALDVRIGEKMLLREARASAEAKLHEIELERNGAVEPAAKRQRIRP
ncbi:Ribosomal lysine N-methyltransferase 4 [Pleurostoma richardsiae]|uniref:Ribosomal lysine N-methyltransferase 4 n=1 Tax=Pleurostoma richardsiae TaxID=41990 RepID=A0AA38RLR3_9PEZI|nr:Ribosomal lysine N-methyltransferase 4 [Pleurostoma richardsiae]